MTLRPVGVAGAFLLAGAAAAQETSPGRDYRIGPTDVIEVSVLEEPNLGGNLTVSEDGTIDLKPLGNVDVGQLTPKEAQARLKAALEESLLQRATVRVGIREFHSNPIHVIGAVNRPGPLKHSSRWRLLEALTAAGGLVASHGRNIQILRRADNGLSDQVEIAIEDLLVHGDPRSNIPVFAGDLINVPVASPVTVFFLGEISTRGELTFSGNERVTVLAAVAKAGGLTNRASKKIVIKRQNRSGVLEEIVVDYKAILAGKRPDVELQAGDVLLAKKAFL